MVVGAFPIVDSLLHCRNNPLSDFYPGMFFWWEIEMTKTIAAFPLVVPAPSGVTEPTFYKEGMDLRDYFAGEALGNMALKDRGKYPGDFDPKNCHDFEWVAQAAYWYADAMMKAREQ